MPDRPTDPRLELSRDDVFTLSGAVAIAIMQMNETDRVRYQELAAKLADILMRIEQSADDQQAEGQE